LNITKVDLKTKDDSIFIELKNKWNTMNSDAMDKCRDKLEKALKDHPKATVYWAFILSKNGDSGEDIWIKKGRVTNNNIKRIWGSKVYELITKDPKSLEKTWDALPNAINDYLRLKHDFIKLKKRKIQEFFEAAFGLQHHQDTLEGSSQ